jgi:hypothetical protein
MQKKSQNSLMVLFALPFLGVGLFMGGLMAVTIFEWRAAQTWEEVPAKIMAAKLHQYTDSDNSTTYSVSAHYQYHYRGQDYDNRQVSFYSGADNIGTFYQDIYAELAHYRDSKTLFRAYVNPAEPQQAVLYRDLRPAMLIFYLLFALVFGGVGGGLLVYAWRSGNMQQQQQRLRDLYPNEAWRWREDWARGRIRSHHQVFMWAILIFAVIWNVLSWGMILLTLSELRLAWAQGQWDMLALLLFPAFGLVLAAWAGRSVLQWRKFGAAELVLKEIPGVVGGRLSATLHIPVKMRADKGFFLQLSCLRKQTQGSGKQRKTTTTVIWQDQMVLSPAQIQPAAGGMALPVLFYIPYDCAPSDDSNADDVIYWELRTYADVPGVDFSATFSVPVFKTARSDSHPRQDVILSHADNWQTALMQEKILWTNDNGARVFFVRARHPGIAAGITLFFLIWTGVCVLLWLDAPWLFAFIFSGFDLILLYFMLELWLKQSTVESNQNGLKLRSSWFGAGTTQHAKTSEVRDIHIEQAMQAGERLFFNLVATLKSEKKWVLGSHIGNRRLAEEIAKRLKAAQDQTR